MSTFEPKILGFCCNWCSYAAADLAGVSRVQYAHNIVIVRVMCSGRVDPKFVMAGFLSGADGVLILGCHLGDCHYTTGNFEAMNAVVETKKLLDYVGLNPGRLMLDWVSAAEGGRFAEMVTGFTDQVRKLGPLGSVEGVDIEELKFELRAAKLAAESEKLRGVAGKQTEFTTKGNKYGEVFTRHEMDRVLEGVIADEVPMSKILLLTREKPLSVKELAARIKLAPPRVLKYVAALRHRGLLNLDSIDKTSPLYVSTQGSPE
ncbi:MAG: hydrogenase iron-sulfur subunit [Chloroflexi bacterium]|nr:hydrogenase iron-sulfur subunit [Chloroflexota bacterium]